MSTPEASVDEFIASAGAAQSSASVNPAFANMLGMLGGAGANGIAALQSQLGVLAAGNPQLAPLLQMLQQRSSPPPADPLDEEPEPMPPREMQTGIAAADVRALLEHSQALEGEVETLRARNDTMAAALGACHLCFGEDRACEVCHGTGLPGWRTPERNAFRRYVRPAVQRVNAAPARPLCATPSPAPAPRRDWAESLGGTEGPPRRRDLSPGSPRRS